MKTVIACYLFIFSSVNATVARASDYASTYGCKIFKKAPYVNCQFFSKNLVQKQSLNTAYVSFDSCKTQVLSEEKFECTPTTLSSDETAFVLVDFWKNNEKKQLHKRTQELLKSLREYNFFVIHGVGNIALKYPEYQKFNKDVRNYLGEDYCKNHWDFGNSNRRNLYQNGSPNLNCEVSQKNLEEAFEISSFVLPDFSRNREYMVLWEDDFRYVLWKHNIKNVVFLGGALEICVLNRPYGIHSLITHGRSDFQIFIAQNYVSSLQSDIKGVDYNTKMKLLFRSLSLWTAQLIPNNELKFLSPNKIAYEHR